MDFSLSEEQEIFQKNARDFLEKECTESFLREVEKSDKGYSPELWRRISDLGWLGLSYPDKYGGTGGSILDLAILYGEMGRVLFPSPHLSTQVLCGQTILTIGSEEQKAELLPKIIKGELILSLALTEPESSWEGKAWDPEGTTVSAAADGDDYIINGTKMFVHDAHIADYILCVTKTSDAATPKNRITLFLVDTKSPGISHNLLHTTAGDKQSEVIFDKVRVPKKNMVGELNGGWNPLEKVLQLGVVLLCAQMVGIGERVLELAVDHAKTRIQFEQPIGVNQYVQEHCVYLLSEVDGSRWVTYEAAWRLSEGLPCDYEASIAKAWTSDSIERACWRAHQVLAGIGYTKDKGVLSLYSRRAKTAQLYLGDTIHHLHKIAKHMDEWPTLEMPKGKALGFWEKVEENRVPDWFEGFAKNFE